MDAAFGGRGGAGEGGLSGSHLLSGDLALQLENL